MFVRVGDRAPDPEVQEFETADPVPLSVAWHDGTAVVLFQRYFGCPFCQLQVATVLDDLERFTEAGATITLVGHGERDAIKLGKAFAPFHILFDPDRVAYAAYGLGRSSLMGQFGPKQWGPRSRALKTPGVVQGGRMGGDLLQLPGTFVVDGEGVVRMAYRSASASDIPDNGLILEAVRGLAST